MNFLAQSWHCKFLSSLLSYSINQFFFYS